MKNSYNDTDIAIVRNGILSPSGDRILEAVKSQNTPAFSPVKDADPMAIAFRAAYAQGFNDALDSLKSILQPKQRLEDLRSSNYQSPND